MPDVVVIGGGPAGSTVASLLARRGRSVVLLEQERFPRFHIGESLLPMSVPLFEDLGVKAELDARFLRKNAAEFVTASGDFERRYPFADGLLPGAGHAWEVDRAELDHVLLDNAARLGADVRQGSEVTSFSETADGVEVVARGEGGREERHRAKLLIDATGQRSFLASRLGLRVMDPELKNFAVFSHVEGAERHTGEREGDISIVLSPRGWWWLIPLVGDRTSVGYVAPARTLSGTKPDADYLDALVAKTPYVKKRLAPSRRVAKVRAMSDYSYVSRQFAGDRWLLLGDAAAFLDPVFSTGVCLGMVGAYRAAESVERALDRGRPRRAAFRDYERFVARALKTYRSFVTGFYAPEFVELLMNPSDRFELRRGVTTLLAGQAVGRLDIAWRSLLFRSLARANRVLPLVPRIEERRAAAR